MTWSPTLSLDCPPANLVGYHGTNVEFEAFDLARAGANFGNAISREGIFFSAEAYVAESVADQVVEEFGGFRRVIQASLRMERGLRLDMRGSQDAGSVLCTLAQAKAGGHDGLIIENWDDGLTAQPETQYVVFDPGQIQIHSPRENQAGQDEDGGGEAEKAMSGSREPGAAVATHEQRAEIAFCAGAPVPLFHGTTTERAELLLAGGSGHGKRAPLGANQGQRSLLYVTTHPENALWFAQQSAGNTVLQVDVPPAQLGLDPEDGVHRNPGEELRAACATGIPASLAVHGDLPATAFREFPLQRPRAGAEIRANQVDVDAVERPKVENRCVASDPGQKVKNRRKRP